VKRSLVPLVGLAAVAMLCGAGSYVPGVPPIEVPLGKRLPLFFLFPLVGLLGAIALGHQDEMMPAGQLFEGFRHSGQQFDFLFGDGARKSANALALFLGHWRGTQALEAVDERRGEARKPVAVREDGLALHCVQRQPHFAGRVLFVVQESDEGCNGALKIDIIFPEGVVGIDEKRLPGRVSLELSRHCALSLSKAFPGHKRQKGVGGSATVLDLRMTIFLWANTAFSA